MIVWLKHSYGGAPYVDSTMECTGPTKTEEPGVGGQVGAYIAHFGGLGLMYGGAPPPPALDRASVKAVAKKVYRSGMTLEEQQEAAFAVAREVLLALRDLEADKP